MTDPKNYTWSGDRGSGDKVMGDVETLIGSAKARCLTVCAGYSWRQVRSEQSSNVVVERYDKCTEFCTATHVFLQNHLAHRC